MTTARPQTAELTIVIGDKNLSSWSLRPWLALHATGYPFRERKILLNREDTRAKLQAVSPTAKVPALIDGELVLWESLAICETLAEWFPAARLWPVDAIGAGALPQRGGRDARRVRGAAPGDADELAAADHEGAVGGGPGGRGSHHAGVAGCAARSTRGDGALLFGGFTLADCMYAPVVTRFRSYGVALDDVCQAYCEAVLALPAMQAWYADAAREVAAG
jgi:glutathione S-transferase